MAEAHKSGLPSLWNEGGFDDFRKEMDDLMSNFFGGSGRLPATKNVWANLPAGAVNPAIDVTEDDEAIKLTAELPGMVEDDVDLSVRDGYLLLKGEKKHEHDEEKDNMHVTERSYGAFRRSMPVPDRVDATKIQARFDKGVLVVTMPKKAEAVSAPQKIKIAK